MSWLNPGFPGRAAAPPASRLSPSASFGAETPSSSTPPPDMTTPLIVGGVGVILGLLLLKDVLTPDETLVGGRNVELVARVHEAKAAQARPVIHSDPGADSYFAARVKNDNRREAQKARLEKWKSSL